jgi:hypothetical protein
MSFFQEVEGESAILVENGVYRQAPLYMRDGYLYAKSGGGFVRLMADGSTTKAGGRLRLDFMSYDKPLCRDPLGRLCSPSVKGAVSLESDKAQLLLGAPK